MASDSVEDAERACSVSLQARFEYRSYPFKTSEKHARCVVSLRAKDQDLDRTPIDLCVVIDRSGSMRGSKLDLVKQAIKFMVQQLSSTDRLSVVSFDAQVQDTYGDRCNMNFMTSGNKKVATACIDRIQAGGGTNLSAGLFRAIDHHQQQPSASGNNSQVENRVKSVFLFTDGISSFGITNRSQLLTILSAMLHKSGSPNLHTFGFGSVYDDQTLSGISEEGRGHCMYIHDAEAIPGAFATALGGLMSVVSQNLELTIAAQEGVAVKGIDTSFRKSLQPDGGVVLSIGDMYAGEQKDLLLSLELPEMQTPSLMSAVVSLEANYLDICNSCMQTSQLTATVARGESALASQPRSDFVLQHVQRCATSNALQAASNMAAEGDLSGARALLASTEAGVMRHPVNTSSFSYAADLRATLHAFESLESYQSAGRHLSRSLGQEHSRQHTSYMGSGRAPMYQSRVSTMMFNTVSDIGVDPENDEGAQSDSSSEDKEQPEFGDDNPDLQGRPRTKARLPAPSATQTAAHSNHHSTTSTVDYQQQAAVSSGVKRSIGQLSSVSVRQDSGNHAERASRAKVQKTSS